MSLIKMLKIIEPSIDPWGTPNRLEHGLEMIYQFLQSVSFHSNNLNEGNTTLIYIYFY